VSEDASFAEILRTVRRQVLTVRERLGEPIESVERTRRTMHDGSLPALKALHLYTQAWALMYPEAGSLATVMPVWEDPRYAAERERRLRGAESLTRNALREDPGFARAWMMLAVAIGLQQGEARADQRVVKAGRVGGPSYLERAAQLVDRATPHERYRILAEIHNANAGSPGTPDTPAQRHELEQSVSFFEALLALQPDVSDVRLLGNIYRRLGRQRDLALMTLRIADARPRSVDLHVEVARELFRQGNLEAAQRYAARVVPALSPASGRSNPTGVANALLMDASIAWLNDDASEALRFADKAAARADSLLPSVARELRMGVWALYSALGRLRQAEDTIDDLRPADGRDLQGARLADLAMSFYLEDLGDRSGMSALVLRWRDPLPDDGPVAQTFLAAQIEAGHLDLAERDLAWFKRRTSQALAPETNFVYLNAAAALELARGRPEAAIGLFRQSFPLMRQPGPWSPGGLGEPNAQYAASKMATALEMTGERAEAISILEEAGKDRIGVALTNTPNRWTRGQAQLAQLYRKNGQAAAARALEARLLKLLALADAGHPLVTELKARREADHASRQSSRSAAR
jgi:hypothetical protein